MRGANGDVHDEYDDDDDDDDDDENATGKDSGRVAVKRVGRCCSSGAGESWKASHCPFPVAVCFRRLDSVMPPAGSPVTSSLAGRSARLLKP